MHKKWTKCKIRRVLSDLDFFCCSNGILPGIESIFSIVPIRKCRRTSVLVHGTKWCTIRRFYTVGIHLSARGGVFPCSVCPFSTTRLAVRERLWKVSRTNISRKCLIVRGHRVLPFMHGKG